MRLHATVVLCLALASSLTHARSDVPASLTEGVESIATAGVPGPVAAFGEQAFAVIGGAQDNGALLPVVAGAPWGQGRVIAFGHGGMIGARALEHPGTSRFVINAVRWLGKGDAPRVLVIDNNAFGPLLTEASISVRTLPALRVEALREVDVLVMDAHGLRDPDIAAVGDFVRRGGGLLTAGLGWGWLQLHPGKTIHDHPGNRLLRDAGLAWCDGTLDPTGKDGFAVRVLPAAVHARAALDALSADGAPPDPQAGATFSAAVRVMPNDDALYQRALALLEEHVDDLVTSEAAPLRPKDGVRRALMALQVEVERRTGAGTVKAHPSSSLFPGEVPREAPRIKRSVEVDLSIPGWCSTGLYAPAGEMLTVTVDGEPGGCSVRIGCHTDHLWHHRDWKRVPDISREWPLTREPLQVASAFGGLVYIEVPRSGTGVRLVTVTGAVEAPRFVLGKTTPDEWARSRAAPALWGELESGKVIVSVPSSHLRSLDDPTPVMQQWDRISDAHATLATIPLQPARPHRFVADVQISAGYMHSGYPIMTHLDAAEDMVRVERLSKGCWGLLHELGHNHQEDEWTFNGTGEVTCNLFALHAIDTVCTPDPGDRGHRAVNEPPSLKEYVAGGADFRRWKRDPFLALHMYVQLEQAFGWETYKRVFAEYRALPADQRPRTDDDQRDQWMVRFSRACGKNLGPFFQAWGVPTSESARKSIADLPGWMPDEMK